MTRQIAVPSGKPPTFPPTPMIPTSLPSGTHTLAPGGLTKAPVPLITVTSEAWNNLAIPPSPFVLSCPKCRWSVPGSPRSATDPRSPALPPCGQMLPLSSSLSALESARARHATTLPGLGALSHSPRAPLASSPAPSPVYSKLVPRRSRQKAASGLQDWAIRNPLTRACDAI